MIDYSKNSGRPDSWEYASETFHEWWNPDKFDLGDWHLPRYCSDHFDIWWDSERYNWHHWSRPLAKYCSEHFKTWWDPDKFNWEHAEALKIHCLEYKHIWEDEYVYRVLENE